MRRGSTTSTTFYKNNGVVFPTLGFPLIYRQHHCRIPPFVLEVHIDVFHSTKRLHTLHFSFGRLIYRPVKTQRKLKTSSSPPHPLQPKKTATDQEDPRGGALEYLTRQKSRLDNCLLGPLPPTRPSSLSRKQNGWLALFFSDGKRERFLLL